MFFHYAQVLPVRAERLNMNEAFLLYLMYSHSICVDVHRGKILRFLNVSAGLDI